MSESSFMVSRQNFMACLGAFSASAALGLEAAPKAKRPAKIEGRKLRIAAIGCGNMGGAATHSLISAGCELVALCDVDSKMFVQWEKNYPNVPKFTDYREMLKKVGDTFDAVQIGTPDHTHAYIAVDCMLAGKHVYVQKPLARTVEECEIMLKVQKKTGVVVQMGNQGHPGVWRYKSLLDAGFWGDVKELHSWSDRPVWPQGMAQFPKPQTLPATMTPESWDCWCGPCPDRGFAYAYHTFRWRGWWDYGCGAIGDMAVHNADPAFWAFGLGLPVKIKADTCGAGPATIAYPKKSVIEMTFAPNKIIKHEVKLTWYDGGMKPDYKKFPGMEEFAQKHAETMERKRMEEAKAKNKTYDPPPSIVPYLPGNGLIVAGDKATTVANSHAARPVCVSGDKEEFSKAIRPGHKRAMYSHYREFVEACLAADPSKCGSALDYAAPLTEALLIGCIALRFPGKELRFDPKRKKFTNCPEANEFLKAPVRGEWNFAKLTASR